MAEPYSPASEARLFPGNIPNNAPARLSARDELLPPSRQGSFSSPSRKNSSQTLLPPYSESSSSNDSRPGASGALANPQMPNPQMDKIKETQEQIAEVTEQLHKNIEMIHERGERLDHLIDKSDQLSISSQHFRTHATAIRRKMWWKNLKWTICIGVLVMVVIAGAVGGGIRGHKYIEEHQTVTETQTVPPQTASAVPSGK